MIEIVFSDSACGALKMAQYYGRGDYQSGAFGVIIHHTDGSKATEEEIKAAQQEFETRDRLAWASAVPMGGNPEDVYGFALALSVGDISESIPDEKRRKVLDFLYSIYPVDDGPSLTAELMKATEVLKQVCDRISAGERARIWYSNQPDELCGMYWFITRLNELSFDSEQISLVKLPEWKLDETGDIRQNQSWGAVAPGEWSRYISLARTVSSRFIQSCAIHWQSLQQENAPLRAVLNGQLVSMPETLYDDFIIREIAAEAEEFHDFPRVMIMTDITGLL